MSSHVAATAAPTAAQLKAAKLIAIVPPSVNGGPERSYDPVHKNFPPVTVVYVAAPVVTPPPPPPVDYTVDANGVQIFDLPAGATFIVPPAPTMGAGQVFDAWADGQHTYQPGWTYTMPAADVVLTVNWHWAPVVTPPVTTVPVQPVGTNMQLAYYEEFDGAAPDPSVWTGDYSGASGGELPGRFGGATHVKMPGDSCIHIQSYPDPAVLAAYGEGGLYGGWVGGGLGAWNKPLPVGSEFYVKARCNRLVANVAMLPGIVTASGGEGWPPEFDFGEIVPTTDDPVPTQMTSTPHYYLNGEAVNWPGQESTNAAFPNGIDFTVDHVFGFLWKSDFLTCTLDGVVWSKIANPSQPGDPHGLNGPTLQALCLQTQTGDPGTPVADPTVTEANAVELIVDWVVAYEPVAA